MGSGRAAPWDIVIEEGTDFVYDIEWQNTDGVPIDMTNYVAKAQVRKYRTSPDVLQEISHAIAGTSLVIWINEIETDALDFKGLAHWDLKLTSPGGVTVRLAEGKVKFSRQVTHG